MVLVPISMYYKQSFCNKDLPKELKWFIVAIGLSDAICCATQAASVERMSMVSFTMVYNA